MSTARPLPAQRATTRRRKTPWLPKAMAVAPPLDPFPEVVGITVHLTFAERAYELARWYRRWGAKVVLGDGSKRT